MQNLPVEAEYPASFRSGEVAELAAFIKHASSVEFVGMKRVGISNFLRYFIYNPLVWKKYFGKNHTFFIPVDLNELIESEAYPFWLLTFKRVLDAVEHDGFNGAFKDAVNARFNRAIQTRDHFLTIDGLRKTLIDIVELGYLPVLFFIRFGRMKNSITPDLYLNLQGLRDATHKKLVYVFTGFRELSQMHPQVVGENTASVFYRTMYLRPLDDRNANIIAASLEKKYHLKVSSATRKNLIQLCGGHVQYLNTCYIALHEQDVTGNPLSKLMTDERISLISDELFSRLDDQEQKALLLVAHDKSIEAQSKKSVFYLYKSGLIQKVGKKEVIFSQFLLKYLLELERKDKENDILYLTDKEEALFRTLKKSAGEICDRDMIIKNVWPEYSESGISDWAIDRLVARLRNKLKKMNSEYVIKTMRTRGFMLIARTP